MVYILEIYVGLEIENTMLGIIKHCMKSTFFVSFHKNGEQ